MRKAATLDCDAVILDLEDAVAPAKKNEARDAVLAVLESADFGDRTVVVRINALSTPWGRRDVAAVLDMPQVQAVALPKVEGPDDVAELQRVMRQTGQSSHSLPVWAFVESAKGVLAAASTASESHSVQALVAGCNDLTKDLRARFRADRAPLHHSLASIVLAARAAGILCLDGVPAAVKPDQDAFRAECEQARDMGFDGKTLIHPATLAITNDVFTPSKADLDFARRVVEAADAAAGDVCIVDGQLIEDLHVQHAKQILAIAARIAEK